MDSTLKTLQVIALDDSPAFVAGLKAMLSHRVKKMRIFTDSEQTLEALSAEVPDVLITDLEMPGKSGIELIRQVRSNPRFDSVLILVLTSRSPADQLAQVIHEGADEFISKDDLRTHIFPKLLALARSRRVRLTTDGHQPPDSLGARLGTCKHEFGNAITAIDGKLLRLSKNIPAVASDDAYAALLKWTRRLHDIYAQLDQAQKCDRKKAG